MSVEDVGGLSDQLRRLIELGVRLRPGVTEQDVLAAVHDPDSYPPYLALLGALAAEMEIDGQPDPGSLATNVGAFDTEIVDDSDSYERPVHFMAAVAGQSARLSDVVSVVDTDEEEGTVSYSVDGQPHTWDVEVNGDWADGMVLTYVLDDLVSGTGQDVAYFYLGQAFGFVVVDAPLRAPLQALLDQHTQA
jgi:hypothetical protein